MTNKRVDIKKIISNPELRRKLMVDCIIATQAREGIVTTKEQAEAAYDKILAENASIPIIQTAEQWADEGIAKYGSGAAAWIGRWMVNCSDYPADLEQLDEALKIINSRNIPAGH